jgi:hypothetical protein
MSGYNIPVSVRRILTINKYSLHKIGGKGTADDEWATERLFFCFFLKMPFPSAVHQCLKSNFDFFFFFFFFFFFYSIVEEL